ncbi:type II secretion system minor pseudopilin GspK [Rhodanobacter aciditrophus]|uniref:Type II secretion system protein K n=1 Tax=Rhodanobacter aciditrophus TaxID=1623218 RepID=A0ABW4AW67_9GAMM
MRRARQRGVALILALMVFAIVSGIAVNLLNTMEQTLSVAEFAQRETAQKETLLGGEAWAMSWLASDELGSESEAGINWSAPWQWTQQVFPLEGENRRLEIQIIERQSCLNVNALGDDELREVTRQRLQRLSSELSLSDDWVNYLTDWIDADQDWSASSSREDEFYQGKQQPYRTGDTAIVSASEWELLGLDEAVLQAIAPYVCALPNDAGVNVNRMSSVLINALLPDLDADQQEQLEARIQTSGFMTLDDFLGLEALEDQQLVAENWRVDVHFVDVYVTFMDQGYPYYLYSQLAKTDAGAIVPVARAFGPFDVLSKALLAAQESN